ncbi:response regulator transcription factor [Stakelama sediminis]|uniref:Two-component system OmpR family response regulator n=1 Tax=Stakelama sediminis TaxID=463200 RepID=A0A840Z3F0_9SPHN|nr:response regulator transcription factor [Stakelama sediminis]MBB5720267.1 two-component system OmpR family response regulator [Stakelama sediminis]
MKLLVIEDDAAIAGLLVSGLSSHGHHTVTASNGEDAVVTLSEHRFDAVILDRMLPGIDGIEVLHHIRRTHDYPPTLILSALGDTASRIEGIEAGADDYLVKPFDMLELNARLNAVVRRTGRTDPAGVWAIGAIEVFATHHKASRNGHALYLNKKEFGLLIELMQHCDQVVTRRMLLERVWGYSFEPGTNIVQSNISRLRTKLTEFGDTDPIETVRGSGYVLHSALA